MGNRMKRNTIIILIASLVLIAGIIVTGCVQNNGSSSEQSPGTSQPSGIAGTLGGSPHQGYYGAGMLSNVTLLTTAAGKLGVSEQDLQNALTSTEDSTTGHPNLTAAAQQLGVTRQQLMDAFGFPAGRIRNSSWQGNEQNTVPNGTASSG